MVMMQDEKWMIRYKEVKNFIETNHRNSSKHNDEERGRYFNWIKHNKKLYLVGELKEDRVEKFKKLLELSSQYKQKSV